MPDNEGRYHSLFDTTPDIVLIMDEHGVVVDANPSVERVLGYRPDELIGGPLSRIMPERYRKRHTEGLGRYIQTGVRNLDWRSIQLPGLTADGREILLAISFAEFQEGERRVFTGTLRDITAEKKTSDMVEFLSRVGPELAASSLDHRATLKSLARLAVPYLADWCAVDIVQPEGGLERLAVAHADPDKVALARQLAERYPPDPNASSGPFAVIRSRQSEFLADIPPAMVEAAAKDAQHLEILRSLGLRSYLIAPLTAHDHVYGAITLVQAESGRCFSTADVPLIEELGRRAGIAIHNAGLYRDALDANELLQRQAMELELQTEEAQALTEELEVQAEDLRLKTEEAEAANKAKSEFLASMSHELRTPLNAIAGYVELLEMGLRGPVTEAQLADLQRIRVSQNHLLGLINDVLNFAKVSAGRLEYRIESVALDQILKQCEAMVLPQIHARRISYSYAECGESVFVEADQEKVQQILLNLMGNAVKFTPEGGSLTASCDQDDEVGRVRIEDTGIGIPADKIDAIFEPFVQVDRAFNQPGHGAGLGLAISRSLARAMGGDIVVSSEPGQGSVFTLTLPRTAKAQLVE